MDKNNNFIQYKIFEAYKYLQAFTTTKQTFDIENIRFTGDSTETTEYNKRQLTARLGIHSNQLIFPRQTHTNCVAEILDIPETELKETDALITNQPGICLCIQTADCVPILLFDPAKKVIVAVHAGWRGTVSRIVEGTIQKMIQQYNSSPENILVAIGPSIGPEIYEVGDDVVKTVKKSIPNSEITLSRNNTGKFHFNLWEANKQILLENEILTENIEILGECSFQNNHKYFSARKSGIETGRMVSGIMLLK
jgi:polyphenol oxidase